MNAIGAQHQVEPSEAFRTGQYLDFVAKFDDGSDAALFSGIRRVRLPNKFTFLTTSTRARRFFGND
jgi:hypothetical protein